MKGTHMKETEDLPDPMITITEMHEYGYQKPDMLPLTKASALEWHRLGEKIYPLFPDGTAGDFSSREQIQMHEGIFGMRTVAWKRIQQESQIDFTEDTMASHTPLVAIDRKQALQMYDAGKQIYLIRTSSDPVLVTSREEIERGSDTFQIASEDWEQNQCELNHSRKTISEILHTFPVKKKENHTLKLKKMIQKRKEVEL